MKIAILGCGNIAATHAQVLSEMGVTLAVCVDPDLDRAKEFAQRWTIKKAVTNIKDISLDEIDVVHICTPPNLHFEQAKFFILAGKHVFCEKPLCFESEQASELSQLCLKKGLVGAVGFNVRYHLACQKIKEYIQSPDFGELYLIHGSYLQEFHALPAPLDWRYNQELAGNMRAVTEIGSHWFDLAEYLTGKKIESICANFANFNPTRYEKHGMMFKKEQPASTKVSVHSEDVATVQLRFSDGVIGSTVLSEISQGRVNRLSLEVTGEHATIWWDSENNNIIYNGKKGKGVTQEILAFGNGFSDTQRLMFEKVYADIKQGHPSEHPDYATFADACKNVLTCNSAYQSAQNNSQWVEIQSE